MKNSYPRHMVVVIMGTGSNLGQGQGHLEPFPLSSPEKMLVVREECQTLRTSGPGRGREHGPWGGTRSELVKQPLAWSPCHSPSCAKPQVPPTGGADDAWADAEDLTEEDCALRSVPGSCGSGLG